MSFVSKDTEDLVQECMTNYSGRSSYAYVKDVRGLV